MSKAICFRIHVRCAEGHSYDDVDHSEAPGHGNSPAAWTCVIVMLVGALIASIAFVIANTPIFVAGAASW